MNNVQVKKGFEQTVIDAIRANRATAQPDQYITVYRGFLASEATNPPPFGNPPVHFKVDVDGVLFSVYVKNR